MKKVIGVISDTHGMIHQDAYQYLNECQRIIHAGDIGGREIIQKLKEIAPLYVVRGNNDTQEWAQNLPETLTIKIDEISIYTIHDIKKIKIHPSKENIQIIITGHSHQCSQKVKDHILYINPGSVGKRRFNLPTTMALLHIDGKNLDSEIKYF